MNYNRPVRYEEQRKDDHYKREPQYEPREDTRGL